MNRKLTLLFALVCATFLPAQVTIFPNGSAWKYLDNGTDQGTAWYGTNFNDGSWASGNGELGYGDGDEATVVGYGGNANAKYATTYFRKTFSVTPVPSYTAYTINLKRDDGVIVYINGVEVYRNNMPLSGVNYTTWASTNCADDGATVWSATLPTSVIVTGTNVIAAEVHQTNATSSDLTFELNLVANTNYVIPGIVKGPYLQVGTPTSMVLRWETNVATDSKVNYGLSASALNSVAINTVSSVVHTVQLSGLTPYTKYYYNIGTGTIITQGDTNNYFLTSPLPGTPGKYRFWMVGDCGNASTNQINCKNAFKTYNANKVVNGMLLSGDNAYSSGTDAEYNAEFFGIYQSDVLKNMPLWSAPGNHDYNNGASTATTVTYFSKFMTPTLGEAGGLASNNPAYYSFDYGNIHFLSLDSYGTTGASQKMYDTTGAQVAWIKQDLAANNKKWTIAYWHHPPYTMGSHNSDTETDLVAIHTKFVRILERYGVDMIVTGHSHDYERSKLMNGHYGNEASFNASTHNLSSSSGLYDGTNNSCPYTKDSTLNKIGTVYVVSGSAGQLGGQQGAFPHNAMHYSNATNGGTFIMDIEDNRLDAKWLCADGVIRDNFTIFKEVKANKSYTVFPAQNQTLTASWPGTFTWGNAATTRTLQVSAIADTIVWVKDPNNCIADTFKLKVLPAINFTMSTPYCAGTAINFSDLSTNNTVAWNWAVTPSTGVTINSNTSKNPGITFSGSGTYTVSLIADNAYGSGAPFSRVITVNALPNVLAVLSSTAICLNQTATLTASGAGSYSWSSGSSNTLITVSPASNSTYTLTGVDNNGCQATDIKTIIVNALPVVTASANPSSAVICAGGTVTLSGSGANFYSWTGGINNAMSFTLGLNSTYTVTGTDLNGCQNSAVKTITVNALPTLTISSSPSNASVCQGSTLTLTASGASTYTWTNAVTNASSFIPAVSSLYTVTGTDVNGCKNTMTQSVTVKTLPSVSITGNAVICAGQTATLTAIGGSSYLWNTTSTNTVISVSPATGTAYSVTGTGTNACQNSAIRNVTVNALPVIIVVSNPANALVCSGSTITLNGAGATTYTWTGGITNGSAFAVSLASTYTVTGTDNNGCKNTAVANVGVNPLPVISISGNQVVCAGQTTTLTANGALSYAWSNNTNGANLVIAPLPGYNYAVTGTDANGCKNNATTSFIVNTLPIVSVVSNNELICIGQSATLSASGALSYFWNNNAAGANIVVTPTANTGYTVNGVDNNNCASTAMITQKVSECTGIQGRTSSNEGAVIYPNPNKGVFGVDIKSHQGLSIEIYNALGEVVYSSALEPGHNTVRLDTNKGLFFYVTKNQHEITGSGKIVIE